MPNDAGGAGSGGRVEPAVAAFAPIIAGILSALAITASFRIDAAAPLIFVALVPVLRNATRSAAAAGIAALVAGLGGYLGICWWIPTSLVRFQGMSIAAAAACFALFAVLHAAQFPLFALAAHAAARGIRYAAEPRRPWALCGLALGWAAIWTLIEWAFPTVLPWSLGGALASSRLLRQAAQLGGVYGLSFTIILVNAALAIGLDQRWPVAVRGRAVACAAAVVGLLLSYGFWRVEVVEPAFTATGVGVGIVQGAIQPEATRGEEATVHAWDVYETLTMSILARDNGERVALVVWPETTLNAALRTDAWHREPLARLSARSGRTLVVGALDRVADNSADYNAAYAFAPFGGDDSVQIYRKISLLPWAEYVPGGNWLREWLTWRTTGPFAPGTDRAPFVLVRPGAPSLRAAPSICAEALQAGWFNVLVRDGASMLLNLSDDGWFAGTIAPALHLRLARMRAVETRRWMVRASNSGASAFIDPTGEIVAFLPFGRAGTLVHDVRLRHDLSVYVRWGDWIVWVSAAIVIAAICIGRPRP